NDQPGADRVRATDTRADHVEEGKSGNDADAGGRDQDDDVPLADLEDLADEAGGERTGYRDERIGHRDVHERPADTRGRPEIVERLHEEAGRGDDGEAG